MPLQRLKMFFNNLDKCRKCSKKKFVVGNCVLETHLYEYVGKRIKHPIKKDASASKSVPYKVSMLRGHPSMLSSSK